jgi:hypothetical protein
MASNPAVEKLKNLGLRHGEKAVIGLAATLFFVFLGLAFSKPSIQMAPEELSTKATSASKNLSTQQKEEDILAKLEGLGIKPATEFEKTAEAQLTKSLNPADFTVKSKWVTPEPGAGLIRDQPVLIAVTELNGFPNRGGYSLFDVDAKGDRIVDDGKTPAKPKKIRLGRNRGRGRSGMMGSGMMSGGGMPGMGMGMGPGGDMANMTPKQKAEAETKRKLDEARLKNSLVGKAVDKPADPAKKDAANPAGAMGMQPTATVTYKETVKGYRSVVLTGVLDNKTLKENYLNALKDPAIAYPNYNRLDVERQQLSSDGEWSKFALVKSEDNYRVLDNLPEVDLELVPEAPGARLASLVDQLPFPSAGYWTGVHVARLVPKEKREIPKPDATAGGMPGMGGGGKFGAGGAMSGGMPGMMGGGGSMSGGMPGMMSGGGGGKGMGGPGLGLGASNDGMAMSGGGMPGMMGGGAGAATGPVEETDFEKSEADEVMVRSIDFTVQPDTTYRYRVRLVVVNPNHLRSDVSPGTDTDSRELKGPWSEPTGPVTVPADVAAYAMTKGIAAGRGKDQITFQVIRWNPEDGQTVVRNDTAGPGELIGTPASSALPNADGRGTQNKLIDFNSRRFVLDAMGGITPLASSLKAGPSFDIPALALVVRPDGAVAVQLQAEDAPNDVRLDMERSYKMTIEDADKAKKLGGAGGMGGMDGGMPGMMGGGRPGGR